MTDGVTFQSATPATPPANTEIATDDAGVDGHVQIVKLARSADGSAVPITADADGMLVNLGTNNDVTVTGTVSVTEPVSVDDNGGSLTVDGTVTANLAAGTNNIGDVDVLSVPAPLSTTGGGTEAAALRVTVATDSTGVLSVDDNGGSLTVDGTVAVSGTVAVTQSGTWDEVGINDSGNSITVDDGGSSLTVDGTVSVSGAVDTELTTADLDTGAGTDTRAVVGIVGSASGGGALIPGSATDGLLVNLGSNNDVTVTGSVTANAGTNLNTSALALESGGNLAGAATSLAIIDDWDESDRAKVNPIVGQAGVQGGSGAVSATTQRVVLATDVALPAGTNAIGKLAANSGVDIGDVDVTSLPALPAGTNAIGATYPIPVSNSGCDIFRSLDLDETEEDVKTSAGTVYGWYIANLATTTRFVKFYNATAANVTVGSTTPVMTLPIPGNSTDDVAANALGGVGIKFDTAICVAATTGVADADTGAPAANDVVINVFYK